MAARKKVVAKKQSTELVNLEDEIAKEIAGINNQVGAAGGKFCKLDQRDGAFLSVPGQGDAPLPMDAVIVEFNSHNSYYSGRYDPNNVVPPDCFAIGNDVNSLAPSPNAPSPQAESCSVCPLNEFGSDGKGKACKNNRVLAILPPDRPDADIFLLRVSPTGLKSFDNYVTGVAARFKTVPVGVITTINSAPSGQGFTLSFSLSEAKPNERLREFWARRDEAKALLNAEPDVAAAAEAPKKAVRKKAPVRRRRAS